MSNPNIPESHATPESGETFGEMFSQYERSHSRKRAEPGKGLEGTVIAVTGESVLLDIGFKTEGILPLAELQGAIEMVKPGDQLLVTITGRDPEGYYELSRGKVIRTTDWSSLEKAFADQSTILGTVTGVVKGGLSVDVGVRAFMPASRSGARDAAEMEKLVGQEIRCRIIKLDVSDEDVVVDHRVLAQDEERALKERRYSEITEGDTVSGVVRSLTDYGAFVDMGGVDGLLHVSDIAWTRVNKASDILSLGQPIEVKVLKVEPAKRRISLGMKQLQPHPWDLVAEKYQVGERVRGSVTRVADFGAFVELEPGVEGLIHISEMSWSQKVRNPSDAVQPGEIVEAVILRLDTAARRISLGLKQALGDPWAEVPQKFAVGSVMEGPVTSLTKFGAFVQLSEGVEGMIHIGEISADKRINHPQDVLQLGQIVKAQVLEVDTERRQLRLSIKQLVPSSLDEYIAEHKEGDIVTGRMAEVSGGCARVELGEGVLGMCRMDAESSAQRETPDESKSDLSSLTSMLNARWKGHAAGVPKSHAVRTGQIRSFRIVKLDPAAKRLELELA
ncbi:MAG: 30S ribosomal protein S1 [Acidobacteria bacterium]|nr:30S ribosomal protein S1 [Acidobacteriota bacterium]